MENVSEEDAIVGWIRGDDKYFIGYLTVFIVVRIAIKFTGDIQRWSHSPSSYVASWLLLDAIVESRCNALYFMHSSSSWNRNGPTSTGTKNEISEKSNEHAGITFTFRMGYRQLLRQR